MYVILCRPLLLRLSSYRIALFLDPILPTDMSQEFH